MLCREIMKQRVLSVTADEMVNVVARKMRAEQIGVLPVCDEQGRAIGVVTDRDIVLRACAADLDGETTPVEKIMTRQPVCCSPDASLEEAEKLMLKHRTRRVLLADTRDKLVGLITLADIAQHQSPLESARWLRELTARRYRVER
jgi:CBS domain-containing protein